MEFFGNASVEAYVKLSSSGLTNVIVDLYGESFQFIIGDQRYNCSPIIAEFLSPKISKLRQSDPTLCEYIVETSDPSGKFKDFLTLALESKLQIAADDFSFFVALANELGNKELLLQLSSAYFSATELTVSNAVTVLGMKKITYDTGNDKEEISFIASHFSEIGDLESLDLHSLRRILGHADLRIESEDSLYNFISRLIQKDPSFAELLEFVAFEFLSADAMQEFVRGSQSFIFESLNSAIWNSICSRLSQNVLTKSSSSAKQEKRFGRRLVDDELEKCQREFQELQEMSERKSRETEMELALLRQSHAALQENMRAVTAERDWLKEIVDMKHFPLNSARPLDGIIAHLTKECGGNVHDREVVNITADRPYSSDPSRAAKNIADLERANTHFYCANAENMWVCYDFKEKVVVFEAYSLRAYYDYDDCNLKTWEIQVSMTGRNDWETVDRQSNNDLRGRGRIASYRLSNPVRCRFIRLKQTGRNHRGDYDTLTSAFEVFGRIAL